jgi:DNA invertase Pin-like site-specific DNA recombinase
MLARLSTTALLGLVAHPVGVEVDIGRGLPSITVVGLGDAAVLQARDRIRAAFGNSGFAWPDRRITISLPPADLPKQGSGFDLSNVKGNHAKIRPSPPHKETTAMGQRAAIYVRISEDRHGTGIKVGDQEVDCRALAERLGLEVVRVYRDNDLTAHKASKRYKERPDYRELLTAIRAGQVDAVLATETERLHRDSRELLDYIDACQPHDVPTYTVRAGQLDLSTSSGRMVAKILAAKAEHEVEVMKDRMRAARIHKTSRGEWVGGRRPFGYQVDGRTVDQVEAEALRWAAAQILAGVSLNAASAGLNKREIRTSTGKEWKPTELRRVLIRARNAGLTVHRGQVVGRAEWPGILDEDTWRGVCAVLGDPARRTSPTSTRRWLMSGLARCEVCGQTVHATSSGKARKTAPAYMCGTGKHVVRNAAEVDAYVQAVIVERLSRPDAADLLAPDQTGDTGALHLKDAALQARLNELGRLAGEGVIDPGQLVQATTAIRRQREEITAQLAAMTRGSVLAGVADAADPALVWYGPPNGDGLDLSRKRAIIDVLIEVVILRTRRGRRPGWRGGETYFDPESVRITWKR